MSKKCMSIMKKGAGGYSGELVSYQPGRRVVVTRGRPRLVRSKLLRVRRDIAEHRVRLDAAMDEARKAARLALSAAGLEATPPRIERKAVALAVAEVGPLAARAYTKGDRRKRAKLRKGAV